MANAAGITISPDCEHALKRASDPANKVDLPGVILAELGREQVLSDPRSRGVAAFAAKIFEQAPSQAFKTAGIRLSQRIALAEAQCPERGSLPTLDAEDQFAGWNMAGGPIESE